MSVFDLFPDWMLPPEEDDSEFQADDSAQLTAVPALCLSSYVISEPVGPANESFDGDFSANGGSVEVWFKGRLHSIRTSSLSC